jgi:hypothetical protein
MSAALRVAQAVRRDSQEEDALLDLTAGICVQVATLYELAGRRGQAERCVGGQQRARQPHPLVVSPAVLHQHVACSRLKQVLPGACYERAVYGTSPQSRGVACEHGALLNLRDIIQELRRELTVLVDGVPDALQRTA